MGSCSLQLPLICLSDETLKPGSSKWVKVSSDVRKALEEYGCFEAQYDQLSMELQESVLAAMDELFALPTEAKQRNVCPKPFTGYLTHNDISESFGIKDANILENAHNFTQLLWPDQGNKSISKTIQVFAEKLVDLEETVRRLILESYGIEKYTDEHLNSTYHRLRLMKYIAPPDSDANATVGANEDNGARVGVKANLNVGDYVNDNGNVGVGVDAKANGHVTAACAVGDASLGAKDVNNGVEPNGKDVEAELGLPGHTDKSLMGIIYQHEIEGLEVRTKEGKWIRVKPAPNTVIVIAGDALCALVNGRIPAPYHRVRVTEKKRTRYSVAVFSNPKAGYLIASPKELVDDKHPLLFKPFDFEDYYHFFNTKAGRKADSPLHAFCAISGN